MGPGLLSFEAGDPLTLFEDAGLERGADGSLRLGGAALESIARDVGTPAYVYHAGAIRARLRTLEEAFESLPHEIHFAVKSNSSLAILRIFKDLGAGSTVRYALEQYRLPLPRPNRGDRS